MAGGFSSESNVSISDCIQRSLLCRSEYMCFFLRNAPPPPRKVPGNRTFSQEPHLVTEPPAALSPQWGCPGGSRKPEGGQECAAYLINEGTGSRDCGLRRRNPSRWSPEASPVLLRGCLLSCAGSGPNGSLPMIKHYPPHFSIPADPRRTEAYPRSLSHVD